MAAAAATAAGLSTIARMIRSRGRRLGGGRMAVMRARSARTMGSSSWRAARRDASVESEAAAEAAEAEWVRRMWDADSLRGVIDEKRPAVCASATVGVRRVTS
jgi:hypothetical protein